VVRVPKFYDKHIRDEAFGYDANIHEPEEFKNLQAFINFLGVQHLRVRSSGYGDCLTRLAGRFVPKPSARGGRRLEEKNWKEKAKPRGRRREEQEE